MTAIGRGDARTPARAGESGELLSQGEVLEHEVRASAEDRGEDAEEEKQELHHRWGSFAMSTENVNDVQAYLFGDGPARLRHRPPPLRRRACVDAPLTAHHRP
jgi:hypothetical protein